MIKKNRGLSNIRSNDWLSYFWRQIMPIKCTLLRNYPYAREECPKCGAPFPEFMRGVVQSWWRRIFKLPYCAVICHKCKKIIGWEKPRSQLPSAKADGVVTGNPLLFAYDSMKSQKKQHPNT